MLLPANLVELFLQLKLGNVPQMRGGHPPTYSTGIRLGWPHKLVYMGRKPDSIGVISSPLLTHVAILKQNVRE
jgi:hypothetical protein